jgi:hypothetical protein
MVTQAVSSDSVTTIVTAATGTRRFGHCRLDFSAGSGLLPLEIKAARRVRLGDVRHLEIFLSDYSRRAHLPLSFTARTRRT